MAADPMGVLERAVRTVAVLASLLVIAGWASFAIDESREASEQSTAAVEALGPNATNVPAPTPEQWRQADHSGVREAIDDANDVLLSPFTFLVSHVDSQWVSRTVPAVLALLLYGFGLSVLARLVHQARG